MTASRGDLDLGELLGPDVTHYRDALAGKTPARPDDYGVRDPGAALVIDDERTRHTVYVRTVERFGEGLPDLASSCTDLALDPEICWDVCGYYLLLGVSWTAGRRELLAAYTARGGPDSKRLTYVLKQLLRDGGALRRRYNRAPLGELFKEDRDVELYLLRLAIRVGQARGASQEDMLREWGLGYQPRVRADEALEGSRDKGIKIGTDAMADTRDPITDYEWWLEDWGWYGLNLWHVPVRAGEILAEWQRLLAAEFSGRGMRVRFAVGLGSMTDESSGHTLHIGPNGSAIFFIHTEQPKPDMAIEAADGYRTALTSPRKENAHA